MPRSCARSSTWARAWNLEVIAEGVESAEQLEFLRRHGCYYAQGRLFGEAMEAEKLLAILYEQSQARLPPHHAVLCAPTVRPSAAASGRRFG